MPSQPTFTSASNTLERITSRYSANLRRVATLIGLNDFLAVLGHEGDIRQDVLRSSVVLMHATLEDFLRSSLVWLLPYSEHQLLKPVRFGGNDRPEKISLADLSLRPETTIRELVNNVVADHMARESFNCLSDLQKWFPVLGVDREKGRALALEVAPMIERRHKIVHESDRDPISNAPTPLDAATVKRWQGAVHDLIVLVVEALFKVVMDAKERPDPTADHDALLHALRVAIDRNNASLTPSTPPPT